MFIRFPLNCCWRIARGNILTSRFSILWDFYFQKWKFCIKISQLNFLKFYISLKLVMSIFKCHLETQKFWPSYPRLTFKGRLLPNPWRRLPKAYNFFSIVSNFGPNLLVKSQTRPKNIKLVSNTVNVIYICFFICLRVNLVLSEWF